MMLLVQLTSLPTNRVSPKYKLDLFRHLHYYKYHALEPKVIETLVGHLSEILPKEQRTEKHDQMVELIIVLLKQLLQIPEDQYEIGKSGERSV